MMHSIIIFISSLVILGLYIILFIIETDREDNENK